MDFTIEEWILVGITLIVLFEIYTRVERLVKQFPAKPTKTLYESLILQENEMYFSPAATLAKLDYDLGVIDRTNEIKYWTLDECLIIYHSNILRIPRDNRIHEPASIESWHLNIATFEFALEERMRNLTYDLYYESKRDRSSNARYYLGVHAYFIHTVWEDITDDECTFYMRSEFAELHELGLLSNCHTVTTEYTYTFGEAFFNNYLRRKFIYVDQMPLYEREPYSARFAYK